MKAKGWNEAEIRVAARETGIRLRYIELRGNFYHFTLKPTDDSFRRYGQSGMMGFGKIKTIGSVCWHGHRDFFRRLFEMNPHGLIVTTMARYEGRTGFEANYPGTDGNIGSRMYPVWHSECCTCSFENEAVEKRRLAATV